MKLYPYQQAIIDKLMAMPEAKRRTAILLSGRRHGMSTFRKVAAEQMAGYASMVNGIRPTCVIIDEVTDWPKRGVDQLQKGVPIIGLACNNVATRQKVLSKRRGRRAKRRALRKG